MMRELADHYPHWSFDSNKGYPCPMHKAALQGYGPSAIHRRTWVFMDHYVPWPGIAAHVPPRAADPVLTSPGSGHNSPTCLLQNEATGSLEQTEPDGWGRHELVVAAAAIGGLGEAGAQRRQPFEDLWRARQAVAGRRRARADPHAEVVRTQTGEHLLVGQVVAGEGDHGAAVVTPGAARPRRALLVDRASSSTTACPVFT